MCVMAREEVNQIIMSSRKIVLLCLISFFNFRYRYPPTVAQSSAERYVVLAGVDANKDEGISDPRLIALLNNIPTFHVHLEVT